MEAAKALGGSFKLVMPVPKPVREMTRLRKEDKICKQLMTNRK